MRQVLQIVTGNYYKVHKVLQSATVITKPDVPKTEKRTRGVQMWAGGGSNKNQHRNNKDNGFYRTNNANSIGIQQKIELVNLKKCNLI